MNRELNSRIVIVAIIVSLMVLQIPVSGQKSSISCSDTQKRFGLAAVTEFSTLFGGTDREQASSVSVDNEGNIILTMWTESQDIPTTAGAFQSDFNGGTGDGVVAKFTSDGQLLFATYLGGSLHDQIVRSVIDDEDNIYVVGGTYSPDLPITDDAFQSEHQGNEEGYIAKFSPNGTLLYCSYFGGEGNDRVLNIFLLDDGTYLLEGYIGSDGFGTEGVYQSEYSGGADTFVAAMNSDMSDILMFTYFGGSGTDYGWEVDLDSQGDIIICGETASTSLPTTHDAICRTYSGNNDGFIAKISSDGSELLYGTYLGGPHTDFGGGVHVDASNNVFITGLASSDFTNMSEYQGLHHGGWDFFAAKFTDDFELLCFKMIGGNSTDFFWESAMDADGNVVLVGSTKSDDYPIVSPIQEERVGLDDACATILASNGTTILMSTYIGGTQIEKGEGITITEDGSIIISGYSSSDDFPVSAGAFQQERKGSADAFVIQIDPHGSPAVSVDDPIILIVGVIGVVLVAVALVYHRKS